MLIIAPYAQQLRNGANNPKNYPYWGELVRLLSDDTHIVQVGTTNEPQLVEDFRPDLSMEALGQLVNEATTWVSVDSFFQHFCWDMGKRGIVIWAPSDPRVFGHEENLNILVDRRYLRQNQFDVWETCPQLPPNAYPRPEVVVEAVRKTMKEI